MDSPCIKQTVCKVLKIFQYGKYLVAYVLNDNDSVSFVYSLGFFHSNKLSIKTKDSLNEDLPINGMRNVSKKMIFFPGKDCRFSP